MLTSWWLKENGSWMHGRKFIQLIVGALRGWKLTIFFLSVARVCEIETSSLTVWAAESRPASVPSVFKLCKLIRLQRLKPLGVEVLDFKLCYTLTLSWGKILSPSLPGSFRNSDTLCSKCAVNCTVLNAESSRCGRSRVVLFFLNVTCSRALAFFINQITRND